MWVRQSVACRILPSWPQRQCTRMLQLSSPLPFHRSQAVYTTRQQWARCAGRQECSTCWTPVKALDSCRWMCRQFSATLRAAQGASI